MFANIRNAIASLIATKSEQVAPQSNLTIRQYQPEDRTVNRKSVAAKKVNFEGISGNLPIELIKGLSSYGLQKQLMSKIVYSYVARGFNEFTKPRADKDRLDAAMNCAAEAVAQADMLGFNPDLDEERWTFLLTTGVPAKLSEANAKLLCDITGEDVAKVSAKREERRKAKFLSNQEALTTYLNTIESYAPVQQFDKMGDPIPMPECQLSLSGASVMAALASYVEFVTTWQDEVKMATEMLLIKNDQRLIEAALARTERTERGQAPAYVSRLDDMLLDASGLAQGAASGR